MVITTRDFNPDTDTGFIIDTMPKAIYYDSNPRRGRPSQKWFKDFHNYLTEILSGEYTKVVIATMQDDQDMILGYSIINHDVLHFAYVKDAYRKQGIASMMVKICPFNQIYESNLTKLGRTIMASKAAVHVEDFKITEEEAVASGNMKFTPPDQLEALKAISLKAVAVKFQSAILTPMNSAEYQLDQRSGNKMRRAKDIYFTPHGVIVEQENVNKELCTIIVPLSNVIQVDLK